LTMGNDPRGHSRSMAPRAATAIEAHDAQAPLVPARPELTPRRLYDSHFAFVWRNLRQLGLPDPVLEDAAQDVFLVVHRRWGSYDAGWSSVETWLFGILLRVARNHRRTIRRRGNVLQPGSHDLSEAVPSAEAGPADVVARREAAALLDRLLDALDDDKRAILVLIDVEQLSVPQAAEALAINVNTAYWRLRAARKQFERALARVRAGERRGGPEGDQR
jgi:RNA polymerase sigma-70 factor (ECF subfamily)